MSRNISRLTSTLRRCIPSRILSRANSSSSSGSDSTKTPPKHNTIFPSLNYVESFPDLSETDIILDEGRTRTFTDEKLAPGKKLTVSLFNTPPLIPPSPPPPAEPSRLSKSPFFDDLQRLHRFPLITKRVVQQTGKGKQPSFYSLVVVGNGRGMVGYGEGKDTNVPRSIDKAFVAAVKGMDRVDRFENRTLWGQLEGKFGATHIIMRARPSGHGLACNPYIHQVCKAAGIADISAKVHRSRNGMQIVKATIRMLHGGHAPTGMGDGVGGKGKREEAGVGMRGRNAIERERGRLLYEGSSYL
ncbi:putative 37S ribosomal protein S5, mitochondrial [Schizosaccharomyces pombe 972h-] [Rhizoctonia solani]|uniref:Small ribosomal subunit protein uS5m n=1 Tax=Rhizoctonia solani TaxID=456999 RepID=A0A0K6GGA5_9AGAM|nr:putative 37S ribosomal protein S5, mitochondrial [Schizosaccharomyces pombe 972h-] [Rhizoctonia solani]